MFNCSDYNRL